MVRGPLDRPRRRARRLARRAGGRRAHRGRRREVARRRGSTTTRARGSARCLHPSAAAGGARASARAGRAGGRGGRLAAEPIALYFGLIRPYKGTRDAARRPGVVIGPPSCGSSDGRCSTLTALRAARAGECVVRRRGSCPTAEQAALFDRADLVVLPYRARRADSVSPGSRDRARIRPRGRGQRRRRLRRGRRAGAGAGVPAGDVGRAGLRSAGSCRGTRSTGGSRPSAKPPRRGLTLWDAGRPRNPLSGYETMCSEAYS